MSDLSYQVCDRLLNPETNEHCEFDGNVEVQKNRSLSWWRCPACRRKRVAQ